MKTQNYKVIGFPAKHSLSPVIHNTLYKIYDIDGKYTFSEIKPEELADFVEYAKAEISGMNVTMPLKNEIKPYLHENNAPYSVNTVKIDGGKLYGYSTDEFGFENALTEQNFNFEGSDIVFLGAGAVTKALAHHALLKGANATILNRTFEKAQAIADDIGCKAGKFLDAEILKKADALINATPLGIMGGKTFESFDFINDLKKSCIVFDLNYSPTQTQLEQKVKEKSLTAINGLSMLIWQAFKSFEIFFGIMPTKEDKQKIQEIIKNK